jgi:NADH:ubiquinone oxidoreductase subunit 5 (subunit L)/multisubunit Na+/H+ antiporter MnhA subunit
MAIVFALGGLVLIGGLALLCFTKAFSIVFLGNFRGEQTEDIHERSGWQLLPMYFTVILMILIGFFPSFFLNALQRPVNLYTHSIVFNLNLLQVGAIDSLRIINWLSAGFVVLIILIIGLRNRINRKRIIESGPTWGCAYATTGSKLQYTAASFVRSFSKLAKPVLDIEKKNDEIAEVFPSEQHYETDPYDKIERIFIDKPLKLLNKVSDAFLFLQNGHLQRYILYGIIFITGVICLPLIFDKIMTIIHFLNNL